MAAIRALTMPKWGLAMTEGAVAAWTLEEGAAVGPGVEILDIETAKITNALETETPGVLRRKVAREGQTLPVGALLGVIAGKDVPEAEIDAFVERFQAETESAAEEAGTAAPEPALVELPGGPLCALRQGSAEGPAVLCLHGFGGDLDGWMFLQPLLAERHDVHAVDLPGHGGSTKAVGDPSVQGLAASVAAYLDAAALERVHLVGHSLGGAVALALALQRPQRVASLTLIAPAGLGAEIAGAYIAGFIAAQRRKDMKPVLEQLFSNPSLVTRDIVETVLRYKRLDGVDAALRAIAAASFDGDRQRIDYRARLAGIAVPVQVIWGEADRIVPAAHADGLPPAITVHRLPGQGHMPHMEAASETARLIEAMIGR